MVTIQRWPFAWLLWGALIGCAADEAAPTVSANGHRDASDEDDGATEGAPHGGRGGSSGDRDAATGGSGEPPDAAGPSGPSTPPPETDGVHVAIADGAYETASEAFYFETDRPGIQGTLSGGVTIRVELSEQLGIVRCSDGAKVAYAVPEGSFIADSDHGECTIDVEAFGTAAGSAIEATFSARVVRAVGEIADDLELHGRVQVGHP